MKKFSLIALALFFVFSNVSCSVFETLVNVSRLKFKLGTVNNLNVINIPVSNKSRLSDFSVNDILKITSSVAKGDLPVTFVLNIDAKNPNDGTGGYQKTNATITKFPWRLLIDNKAAISGDIASTIFVPGTGETTTFPITITVDILDLFKDQGYESILNLLLNIGGQKASSQRLTVFAQPTVSTGIGPIKYPSEIKIVDLQFND